MISPNDENVVLFMPFSEGSGSTAYDYSVHSNNGSITGASYVKVKDGDYAMSFDGSADKRVDIPDSSELRNTDLTIGMWVMLKGNLSSYQQYLIKGRDSQTQYYSLQYRGGDSKSFSASFKDDSGNTGYSASGILTPAINEWHFVVGVFDRTAKKSSVYVDGEFDSESNVVSGTVSLGNTGVLRIGEMDTSGTYSFPVNGKIRLPFIINTKLSQDAIKKIYQDTYIE